MKQLKLALAGFAMMAAMLTGCSSCEKTTVEPDPNNNGNNGNNNNGNNNSSTEVTAGDLLNYYAVVESSNKKLRVLYFIEENGKIMAYMDGLDVRRGQEVGTLAGEKLSFEFNSGVFYNYQFDKENGNVVLKSCTVSGTDATVTNAQMDKTTNAPKFYKEPGSNDLMIFQYTKTETYCGSTDTYVYLYFDYNNGPVWKRDGPCGPSQFSGYYFIGNNVGWKSNDEKVFGTVINNWKGSGKATMILQTSVPEMQPGAVHTAFIL